MIDLQSLTITSARKKLDAKEFSAVSLAQAYLDEIEKKNESLNAYLEVYGDVIEQATYADNLIAEGKSFPLLGIPLAIKDNILIKGKKVTAASKILGNYIATYDATVIKKLKENGAVFLGRANMDEFAMGGSTENSAFGPTKNPHDISRVAGGSSGGSAAIVAADLALGALGSDTGGSIREPASFCGVVGFKPTYGVVSRYGLMALGSSLDCIGPITKTVEDSQIILEAIKGLDILDSTTIAISLTPSEKAKVIGVPWSVVNMEGVDPKVKENFLSSIEKLKVLGYEIKDISLPNLGLALAIYYIIMPAEASSNLSRFDGIKFGLHVPGKDLIQDYNFTRGQGFGLEVRRRILLGTYVLSSGYYDAYYSKAEKARAILKKEFENAFKEVSLILTPTAPFPAWKIGEKNDPLSVYLADIFTVTANIVGVPAISIPSGVVEVLGKNLPVGIQFMAPQGEDSLLFEVGKIFESK
ncbi:Asp-tRNA(Asn)/Glu-tRNA(Gln) amidotransferase subunit GatA [Patescibacteria group bacterium]|nr:Asp-tRNA(Asn)/Glu-tRNA(Gln) amidotransferase subunit GatA [Patescibacteria group bacterium]